MPHRLQIIALQQLQGLQHHRPLCPKARLNDGVAAVTGGLGRVDFSLEIAQIFVTDQAAIGFGEGGDFPGDRTAIEVVADRLQLLRATAALFFLRRRQFAQRLRERGLLEDRASLRHLIAG